MKPYHLNDVFLTIGDQAITVENEAKKNIGSIRQAIMPACEKGHAFSFTSQDDFSVMMGIKKRGIRNFLVATYFVQFNEKNYVLKDKIGNHLFYFCVTGNIEDKEIKVAENWSGDVEVMIDRTRIAIIKPGDIISKAILYMKDDIHESSPYFGISILMYFMYKIYKNESDFIEELLFDL